MSRPIPPELAAELPAAPESHPITRARQHYGLELTREELAEAERAIADPKNSIILRKRERDGASERIFRIKGVAVRAIVSRRGTIITILPANATITRDYGKRKKNGKWRRRRFKP